MTENHSTAPSGARKSTRSRKPKKPYPEFPLFPHATKSWAKKIRGKTHYFGPWDDPDGALAKYQEQKDDLHAGKTPRVPSSGLTMRDLAIRFLTHKRHLLDTREITQRTWVEYHSTCERLVDAFKDRLISDLVADDFEVLRADIAVAWGAIRLGNEIQRVRSVFKYGYESNLIATPVRFGPAFKRPARKVLRKLRAKKGPRLFEPQEIHALLKSASVQVGAMILLGVNCGFGNEDVATLTIKAIDLETGWVKFPRPKTGIDRKCKLWPETIKAIKEVLANRPKPKEEIYADRVFVTKHGKPWANDAYGTAITHEMTKLLAENNLTRPGLGFYALRHTFRTIADGSRDQPAIDFVMGHARDEDMASHYRERIEDARIAAVTEHVHAWLFAKKEQPAPEPAEAESEILGDA